MQRNSNDAMMHLASKEQQSVGDKTTAYPISFSNGAGFFVAMAAPIVRTAARQPAGGAMEPLLGGYVKYNIDAAFFRDQQCFGIGIFFGTLKIILFKH